MRVVVATILGLFVLTAASSAAAECVAQSAAARTHLVELFTSEGCSSCPPADAWLRGLRASARVQPLEWHVDYWDSLGWPDRFDDARYTARQQQLASRSQRGISYTPEVALDGREWRGWNHADTPLSNTTPAPAHLTLTVQPGNPLHVALRSMPIKGDYRAYFVVAENGLSTAVRAGENDGVVLRHDHTVRALAGPLPLDHAQADIKLPADVRVANASVIAFVQDPATGAVAQVVRQPLLQCR